MFEAIPPPGAEVKTWGWNFPLHAQTYRRQLGIPGVLARTVRACIVAGGYSSIHLHVQSHNAFSVRSGVLKINRFNADMSDRDEIILQAGDHPLWIPAGELHQFVALTNVEVLEIYVATDDGDCGPTDIKRFSENGVYP